MVLKCTHGAAVAESAVGVLSTGHCDILEEHLDAHVVRVCLVPHRILVGYWKAVNRLPVAVHLFHSDPHVRVRREVGGCWGKDKVVVSICFTVYVLENEFLPTFIVRD